MRNLIETSTIAPTMSSSSSLSQQHDSSATTLVQHSPWHSPVPYLFGGLAAMLGLIAFALLILACSYWKLSSGSESEGDVEKGDGEKENVVRLYEEKIVVIMAGDEKPTYLATPVCSRGSSFGDNSRTSDPSQETNEVEEKLEKTTEDLVVVVVIQIPDQNTKSEEATSRSAPATSQPEDQ